MKVADVYQKFELPKNLQQHMLRVAAVGQFLIENWSKPQLIDRHAILTTLLVHDLGNLLKFDLANGVELFDPSERDVEYWHLRQEKMRDTYGHGVHAATEAMAQEIGVMPRALELLKGMGSSRLSTTLNNDDWDLKICTYSDLRVDPQGFVSVEERFSDILTRYFELGVTRWSTQMERETERERTLQNCTQCLELEQQLQAMILAEFPKLHENRLDDMAAALRDYELTTA